MTTKTAKTKNLFSDTTARHWKLPTREAAVTRIERVRAAFINTDAEIGTFNYVIAVNEDGTFTPVVILRDHQKVTSQSLIENGIAVAG